MQKGRPKGTHNKVGIYLRLSANVVEWLKAHKGYNAIVDRVLGNYINRHKEDALQEKLDRLNKKVK